MGMFSRSKPHTPAGNGADESANQVDPATPTPAQRRPMIVAAETASRGSAVSAAVLESASAPLKHVSPAGAIPQTTRPAAEAQRPTTHPKIRAATGSPRPLVSVIHDIRRLEAAANGAGDEVRELLCEIVLTNADADAVRRSSRRRAA